MTKTMLEDDDAQNAEHLDQEPSEWQKPLWIASAIFLLALVGIVVWLVATKPAKVTPRVSQAQRPAAPSVTTTHRVASPTACTLPAGDQTIPYKSPPGGVQWGQVGSMSVPQAPGTLGPQHTSGVWETCFARSPAGALLAAMNFWAESTTNPPRVVLARLAVGPQRPVSDNTTLDQDFQGPPQVAGYEYQSYDRSQASVVVALRAPNGNVEALATVMRWTGSDWRFVRPPSGVASYETFADLPPSYVQWSGF